MLNRSSVAGHRKNCSLTYHWEFSVSKAAHPVNYILPIWQSNHTVWRHIILSVSLTGIPCKFPPSLFLATKVLGFPCLSENKTWFIIFKLLLPIYHWLWLTKPCYPWELLSDVFSLFFSFSRCSFGYLRRKGERSLISRFDCFRL